MTYTFSCMSFTIFDFQNRTCYKVKLFPLKSSFSSLKKLTLPTTTIQFFRSMSNLSFLSVFMMFLYNQCIKYMFLSGPGGDNMGEIGTVSPGKTRRYPHLVCKN